MYWTVFKCSMALDLISFALFDVFKLCLSLKYSQTLIHKYWKLTRFVLEPFLMPEFIEPCLLSANANKNKHNMAILVVVFVSFFVGKVLFC